MTERLNQDPTNHSRLAHFYKESFVGTQPGPSVLCCLWLLSAVVPLVSSYGSDQQHSVICLLSGPLRKNFVNALTKPLRIFLGIRVRIQNSSKIKKKNGWGSDTLHAFSLAMFPREFCLSSAETCVGVILNSVAGDGERCSPGL